MMPTFPNFLKQTFSQNKKQPDHVFVSLFLKKEQYIVIALSVYLSITETYRWLELGHFLIFL